MAFNFGGSGGFGQSSTPAFGSFSAPAFGATSAPAFGASSTPAFGQASSPGFNFANSAPAFAAFSPSTPAFGASSGGFSFGGASTASSSSQFAVPATFPGLGASAPGSQLVFFGQQQQQLQQQQQQQQQHQLTTKAGQPISDSTPWEDISEPSQQVLKEIEKRLMDYRQQKQQLEQDSRLQASKATKEDIEANHQSLTQMLTVLGSIIKSDSDSIDSFRERVMQLLHHTEVAVMVAQRAERWRAISAKQQHGQAIDPAERERLVRLPVTLPSNFLRVAVQQFQETLQQYQQLVQSLERVVQPEEGLHPALQSKEGDEAPLQVILHNLYRYLTAVAANLDRLHEAVADARQAFLDKQKQEGNFSDPFAEADLREAQHRKAERLRSHAHATQAVPQPQSAAPSSAPQLAFGATPPATSAPGGMFGSAAAFGQSRPATSSMFGGSQPASGGFFGSSQPASGGLFGSSQPSTGTGLFGTPQSAASGFGASQSAPAFGTPSTPPAFGAQPANPFGKTPQSTPAFGQPFGGGFGSSTAFNRQPSQTTSKPKKTNRR